jgi:hypothetical protein
LLGTIPIDQSLFFADAYKAIVDGDDPTEALSKDPPKNWYKEELDKRRGRSKRQRVATSIDDMITDQKRIGKEDAPTS